MDVSSFWQDITRGIVIIVAVFVDGLRKKMVAKRMIAEQQKKQASS